VSTKRSVESGTGSTSTSPEVIRTTRLSSRSPGDPAAIWTGTPGRALTVSSGRRPARTSTELGCESPAGNPIALASLLPDAHDSYPFHGSLTTPPCSEVVRWLLLDEPLALSPEQVAAFRAIYAGNARPTQPLGERDLLWKRR